MNKYEKIGIAGLVLFIETALFVYFDLVCETVQPVPMTLIYLGIGGCTICIGIYLLMR